MGTLYGPTSALPKYLAETLKCPGTRKMVGSSTIWKGCNGKLETWYEGAEDRTVWKCSKCGDRNIAKGKADDPRRKRKNIMATGRKRDSQRQAVYNWELSLFSAEEIGYNQPFGRKLTLDQCRKIIATVWDDYGLADPPTVKDGRGSRSASGSRKRIRLPLHARTPPIVLHEIGHSLQEVPEIWSDRKENLPWHGPGFAALMLDLWRRYLGTDHVAARKAGIKQKPRKVRFAKLDQIPKPVKKTTKLRLGG